MSSYLTFRKNNVDLISYSRSSTIYQACQHQAPYGKLEQITKTSFDYCTEELEQRIKNYTEQIALLNELLTHNLPSDELREILSEKREYQTEIDGIKTALIELSLLWEIGNEKVYIGEKEQPLVFEWGIDA